MTATLVSNQLTAIQHEFDNSAADYTLTEIIPVKKEQVSLYVLNVYSSPKDQSREVTALLESTTQLAKKGQLVITGDFNAPHVEWGYHKSFKKGNILWNKIQGLGLSLLNDPHTATRTCNSISRDTTPDLTLAKNVKNPVWRNTGADLNSDHYILATTLRTESNDVTIWTNCGSEGQIEEALQAAADTVEEEARRAGLECSQPKSELLVLRRSKKPEDKIPIDIKIQGQNIEEVENVRVLGLHISNTPSNIAALGKLES
ncbi:hypothetical protein ISCGN_026770 [Ixodes scapularis]